MNARIDQLADTILSMRIDRPTREFYAAAAERNRRMTTNLIRRCFSDAPEYEYEARCVDTRLPSRLELTVASDQGFMDAIHTLQAGLEALGYPRRLNIEHIERITEFFDD